MWGPKGIWGPGGIKEVKESGIRKTKRIEFHTELGRDPLNDFPRPMNASRFPTVDEAIEIYQRHLADTPNIVSRIPVDRLCTAQIAVSHSAHQEDFKFLPRSGRALIISGTHPSRVSLRFEDLGTHDPNVYLEPEVGTLDKVLGLVARYCSTDNVNSVFSWHVEEDRTPEQNWNW